MKSPVSFLVSVTLLVALGDGPLTAEARAEDAMSATLHLSNGDYLAGELRASAQPGLLRWQGSAFAAPLDFPLGAVSAVSFAAHGPRPRPAAAYGLELHGGDVLRGDLVGLSSEECRFDAAGLGLLHIQRSVISRIVHTREGVDLVYLGPNGLLEWKQSPEGAWKQDGGRVSTDQPGASIVADLGLPKQACIDFALSWTSDPDFSFVFGTIASATVPLVRDRAIRRVDAEPPPVDGEFRMEVFSTHLVLVCERGQKADLVPLQKIGAGAGRCHFRIYLDQEQNRAFAFAADGKPLADMSVGEARSGAKAPHGLLPAIAEALDAEASRARGAPAPKEPEPGTCLRLVNHRGNVRLEQLSITRWDGQPPAAGGARRVGGQARLVRHNGSILGGQVEGFDASTKEFLIAEDGRTSRIPADAVQSILFSSPGSAADCDVRVTCEDGLRVSGKLRKVENGLLRLGRLGIAEPLAIRLSSLHSLVVLEAATKETAPALPASSADAPQKSGQSSGGRSGTLEGDGLRLQGCLIESAPAPGASCLAWRPRGSASSSPLRRDFSGRIVYRDPPPAKHVQVTRIQSRFANRGPGIIVMGGWPDLTPEAAPSIPPWKGPALYLRTGDMIACEVKRIDERGVTIHSPRIDATFVPNGKVRAVELENRSRATKIDIPMRDRLLTLPRLEKDDPPTHLIRSIDGDYLRGRLVAMDDKTLTVEVRSESRRVDRDCVTSIIWLDVSKAGSGEHGAGSTKQGAEGKEQPAPRSPLPAPRSSLPVPRSALPGIRVQALRGDGVRLTFRAERVAGTILQGTSDVLGACRVELGEVDQLIIGGAIERAAQALPYQRWTLTPAIEPKFAQDDQGGAGLESELVGKPAPDFELETLDGKRFRLSDHRQQIVVVDFWATWCGPCRQTLPELVRAAAKFQDRNVVLLTVNLQETPEAIKTMMARLELKMPVGLDRDGAVAEKYAAAAIPQTVIIDKNGNLARLFVGGGPQYFDQLSAALEALLNPVAAKDKQQ